MNTAPQLERQRVATYRSALGPGPFPDIHWVPEGNVAACGAVVVGDIVDWPVNETSPWPTATICYACRLKATASREVLIF